jgi:hypothetical protein
LLKSQFRLSFGSPSHSHRVGGSKNLKLILESHSKRGGPKNLTNLFARKHLHDAQLLVGIMNPTCTKQRNAAASVRTRFHQILFLFAATIMYEITVQQCTMMRSAATEAAATAIAPTMQRTLMVAGRIRAGSCGEERTHKKEQESQTKKSDELVG